MDGLHEGQKVWVEQVDGSQRPGIFVGEAEGTWFGGSPGAYAVYPETRTGEEVPILRIIPRDDDDDGDDAAGLAAARVSGAGRLRVDRRDAVLEQEARVRAGQALAELA